MRRRGIPQPAVIAHADGRFELVDQRSGFRVGIFDTAARAREEAGEQWPAYEFEWSINVNTDEAIGRAVSVRVYL